MPAIALTLALVAAVATPAAARKANVRKLAAEGVNAFALDMYTQLAADSDDNLFFSPYSISAAMALAMLGAGSATAVEIRTAMHYPQFDSQLHAGMARLERAINREAIPDTLDLSSANALWIDESFELGKRYRTHLDQFYGAGLERADFMHAPGEARGRINAWVEKQTHDRIKDLFPEGSILPETRFVIANAIYFKGLWAVPFDPDLTETVPFALAGGDQVDTDMMHLDAGLGYAETDDYQLLELPYLGGDLKMDVVLPRDPGRFDTVEQALVAGTIDDLTAGIDYDGYHVDVFLPRFTMDYSVVLNDALEKLGVQRAFSDEADFSGLSEKEKLKIDIVVHKAFVEVTEEGTEAAAATGITMKITSVIKPARKNVTFRADHPFVYLIRDRRTGVVLFMGRMMNPAS